MNRIPGVLAAHYRQPGSLDKPPGEHNPLRSAVLLRTDYGFLDVTRTLAKKKPQEDVLLIELGITRPGAEDLWKPR
jgi:hypothetical protein